MANSVSRNVGENELKFGYFIADFRRVADRAFATIFQMNCFELKTDVKY